jgi:hypothetical protein
VRARVDAARARWGTSSRVEVVDDKFVIVAADRNVALDKAVTLVRDALRALVHDRPRLDALFGMSDETFLHGDRLRHDAMARALCEWLDERHSLLPFYQAWRDQWRADPDGRLAFQSVVHDTPEQENGEWTRWVVERSRGYVR